jgi:hypothetical protein
VVVSRRVCGNHHTGTLTNVHRAVAVVDLLLVFVSSIQALEQIGFPQPK